MEKIGAWEIVDRPTYTDVIESTWACNIKRFPSSLIKKFKARFCAWGDQKLESDDYFEIYVPVIQCATVILILILVVILDLK